MWMAKAKQATTIATQIAFKVLDVAVEICARPWIVELTKKSRQIVNTFLLIFFQLMLVAWYPAQVGLVNERIF